MAQLLRHTAKKTLFGLASFTLIGGVSLELIQPAIADVPTITYSQNGHQLKLPAFNRITFLGLGAVQSSGSFALPSEYVNQLGYNPSRSWRAGQTLAQLLWLGDFESSFQLQKLTLNDIGKGTNANVDLVSLASFGLMNLQRLGDLAGGVPGLDRMSIKNIRPVLDLLVKSGLGNYSNQTLGHFLEQKPQFKNVLLSSSVNLGSYRIADIPNLKNTKLSDFFGWQISTIDSVPYLRQLPFNNFPNPPQIGIGQVAIANILLGDTEQSDPKVNDAWFVSGSAKQGNTIPVKCPPGSSCSHIELSHPTLALANNHGRRWVSGLSQQVSGGERLLAVVNGGKEPTGRLVFGDSFKVVITRIDDSNAIAHTGLYFRICHRPLGCTPYFIGPVPWIPVRANDWVILGTL